MLCAASASCINDPDRAIRTSVSAGASARSDSKARLLMPALWQAHSTAIFTARFSISCYQFCRRFRAALGRQYPARWLPGNVPLAACDQGPCSFAGRLSQPDRRARFWLTAGAKADTAGSRCQKLSVQRWCRLAGPALACEKPLYSCRPWPRATASCVTAGLQRRTFLPIRLFHLTSPELLSRLSHVHAGGKSVGR